MKTETICGWTSEQIDSNNPVLNHYLWGHLLETLSKWKAGFGEPLILSSFRLPRKISKMLPILVSLHLDRSHLHHLTYIA